MSSLAPWKIWERPYVFLIAMVAVFLVVSVFLSTSLTFIFTVTATLLAWFLLKWDEYLQVKARSRPIEIVLGVMLVTVNIGRNMLELGSIRFGLVDMLVTFVGLWLAFFGARSLRFFALPTIYLVVLIVGYQLEFSIAEVKVLEDSLARFMSSVMAAFGIPSSPHGNLVVLDTPRGSQALAIDAPCTGIKGMLAYGSLSVLTILDAKASLRRKAFATGIGLLGTVFTNLLRLTAIFLAVYFLGVDIGLLIHTYLGYGLFIVWIFVFCSLSFRYLLTSTAV